jgi:hypothetical protein
MTAMESARKQCQGFGGAEVMNAMLSRRAFLLAGAVVAGTHQVAREGQPLGASLASHSSFDR